MEKADFEKYLENYPAEKVLGNLLSYIMDDSKADFEEEPTTFDYYFQAAVVGHLLLGWGSPLENETIVTRLESL